MKVTITENQFNVLINNINEESQNNGITNDLINNFVNLYSKIIDNNKDVTKNSDSNTIKVMQIALLIVTGENFNLTGTIDQNTESKIKIFQSENGLNETGYFDLPTIGKISEKLIPGYKATNFNLDNTIQVVKPSLSDDDVYKTILKGIGAPITKENMKFMYAWRQGESGKATYNPFNTTKKKENSNFYNCIKRKNGKCIIGVRNYGSQKDGIDATIGTLTLDYYDCITNGLKNNIGAEQIATKCRQALKTWGTGDLVAKVLGGSKLTPPPIPTSITKTVS